MPFPEPSALVDRDLVFTFFWRFRALEAALIADPQIRQVRKKNLAPDLPGWGQFTKALEQDLRAWESPTFREAATELLDCGVRRQVVRDDTVTWELLTPTPSASPVAFTIDTLICMTEYAISWRKILRWCNGYCTRQASPASIPQRFEPML